ncbi:MAG: class IV adenylate cyclase [Planctomycetaceae bacterium]
MSVTDEAGMEYEVEIKFWREAADGLEFRIAQLGGVFGSPVEQHDAYFSHPVRDFSQTDEAFRIRSEGHENRLTFKGPKVDDQSKTRRELEVPIASGADARRRLTEMLAALGFREVLRVVKFRRSCRLTWEDRKVELALDNVDHLGEFVELETMAPHSNWRPARDSLARLAEQLQLRVSECRSYLELLLAERRQPQED